MVWLVTYNFNLNLFQDRREYENDAWLLEIPGNMEKVWLPSHRVNTNGKV